MSTKIIHLIYFYFITPHVSINYNMYIYIYIYIYIYYLLITICTHIYRQKNIDQLTFSINEKQIENVKFFKFLGIMFDEHLTWKNHIIMVTNKLSKFIGILNRLKNIYPQQALLSIYNALFLSHMTYGLLLWGNQVKKVSKLIINSLI